MLYKDQILSVYIPCFLIGMLFVTTFIVSSNLYNGVIVAKEFWFFGVVAAMILYFGVRLIFKKGDIKVNLNIRDCLLLAFYAWCFIRAIFTPNTPFWHNNKLQVLTGMMVVYFFVRNAIKIEGVESKEEIKTTKSFILQFIIFVFILSGFLQAIYGLLQLYGICPSHHNLFKITGSFLNPAPYALYLAVVYPVALTKILFVERDENNDWNIEKNNENKNHISSLKFSSLPNSFTSLFKYYFSLATVIAIVLVLPATMIRAAWLGVLTSSMVLLQYRYHYIQWFKKQLNFGFKRTFFVCCFTIIFGMGGIGLYKLKEDSATGKLFIWEVTIRKVIEKPLFGYGLGRFKSDYNNWQAEYFQKHSKELNGKKGWLAGNTRFAFNEFLEMASEIGIIGLLLFLSILGSIFLNIKSKKNKIFNKTRLNTSKSIDDFIVSSMVISLITCAFVSYPFYSLPTLILLFVLLGISRNYNTISFNIVKKNIFSRLSIAVMLAALFICFTSYIWKIQYYEKWQLAEKLYYKSKYRNANALYKEISTSLSFNGTLLQNYGKSLQMNGDNKECIKLLQKARKYTTDHILYTTLGDAYKGLKLFDLSEKAYRYALYLEPNKFYPKYLLAKLYYESGQKSNARRIARDLINSKVKINSIAIEEMKAEMKVIIENSECNTEK